MVVFTPFRLNAGIFDVLGCRKARRLGPRSERNSG